MVDNTNAKAAPKITENKNAFLAECAMKYQQYWHRCHQSFCRQSVFQGGRQIFCLQTYILAIYDALYFNILQQS
jgi:hypothetical protein